jgi:hypothetical protein
MFATRAYEAARETRADLKHGCKQSDCTHAMKVRVLIVVDVVVVVAAMAARVPKPATNLLSWTPCNNTITHIPIDMIALIGVPYAEKTCGCSV